MRHGFNSGRWLRRGNMLAALDIDSSAGETLGHGLQGEAPALLPVLRLGSTGAMVRDLQARLLSRNLNVGIVDGVFGTKTKAAVESLQRQRGLDVDGIVGPQTWAALGAGGGLSGLPVASPVAPPASNSKLTLENIQRAMTRKGYVIFSEPYRLNIVGVRSASAEPNRFDDSINVFFRDEAGRWVFKSNRATNDPGLFYLLQPMNVKGTAILVPGQYRDSHQLGLHRGQYKALVQRGPMTVTRDADKDDQLGFRGSVTETGYFGINIHRASASGVTGAVDRYSAGCQVFASASDFQELMTWSDRHARLHGNKFTYTLLEEADLGAT